MNLNILYGPPGSGKTTAIQSLLEHRDFSYISIGEIYRKELEKDTAFGKELRGYVEANIIYPEDVIRRIVEPYLLDTHSKDVVILDGFPKHEHELRVLNDLLERYPGEIQLGKVISIEIDLQDALHRMAMRFVCTVCDFHADSNAACPRCGSERMIKRNDDNDSEFIDRFQTYVKNNSMITSRLSKMGFEMIRVDAFNSKTVVRSLIENAVFGMRESEGYVDFGRITGLDSRVISTIDHPYVSPPIRLVDSHRILFGIQTHLPVTLLNWNVSQANARTYRYDMQLDLLFLGRSKQLFLFEDGVPFALQTPQSPGMSAYENAFINTLARLKEAKKITQDQERGALNNFHVLKSNVLDTFVGKDSIAHDYTKRTLVAFNALIDRPEIAEFINRRYVYYYESSIMREWIPFCLENIRGERSVVEVMKAGVFGRKILRNVSSAFNDDSLNSVDFVREHLSEIKELIREGALIPSIELLYWSMEYAGLKHFGNDYDFFEKYGAYLGVKLDNQLTSMSDDGRSLFVLDKDYGVSLDPLSGRLISKSAASSVKATRVNSIYAFYILLGDEIKMINNQDFRDAPRVVGVEAMPESLA